MCVCAYMCVCMLCMCECVYVCVWMRMRMSMCICICTCIYCMTKYFAIHRQASGMHWARAAQSILLLCPKTAHTPIRGH